MGMNTQPLAEALRDVLALLDVKTEGDCLARLASGQRIALACADFLKEHGAQLTALLSEHGGGGEAVAWTLRFRCGDNYENVGDVNAATTFASRREADEYADLCATNYAYQPKPGKRPIVVPLYTTPQPVEARAVGDDVIEEAKFWRAFCDDADAGTFPVVMLDDAKHLGAGVLELHYRDKISAAPGEGSAPRQQVVPSDGSGEGVLPAGDIPAQARAWLRVCELLDELDPLWSAGQAVDEVCAITAIRRLTTTGQVPDGWQVTVHDDPPYPNPVVIVKDADGREADVIHGDNELLYEFLRAICATTPEKQS